MTGMRSLTQQARYLKLRLLTLTHGSLFSYRFRDSFYTFHQSKLRGDQAEISKRLEIYLPYLKRVKPELREKYALLDCGFGRGDFMQLVRANKISTVVGVDTNADYVLAMQEMGMEAIHEDMIAHLYFSERQYCGISGFHVIEHLTFDQLFDFLLLAHKRLVKGGALILETPNIENIIVSSTSYYYDPTHIQKVAREVIDKLLDYLGFSKIIFLPLHPLKLKPRGDTERFLFGAQDMGIIAYK